MATRLPLLCGFEFFATTITTFGREEKITFQKKSKHFVLRQHFLLSEPKVCPCRVHASGSEQIVFSFLEPTNKGRKKVAVAESMDCFAVP